MRILYLGDLDEGCTSLHRCEALRRIGHEVTAISPRDCIKWNFFSSFFHHKSGFYFGSKRAARYVKGRLGVGAFPAFDLVWVDNGEIVSRDLLRWLHSHVSIIINYNCDDPTGRRDGNRWFTFRKALPEYDLAVVVRDESRLEYPLYGAKKIHQVWRSSDEVAHAPRPMDVALYEKWKSDVAFVGTWMPERGPFMLALIDAGVPISIWGSRWHRAKEWHRLKPFWRGGALSGDSYAYAIQGAKVNLGLLSKGNRDLHTTRTAEIPALGGLLCAERTVEHVELYREGVEAVFWSSAEECIAKMNYLLAHDDERIAIAKAGHARHSKGLMHNEYIVSEVLRNLT